MVINFTLATRETPFKHLLYSKGSMVGEEAYCSKMQIPLHGWKVTEDTCHHQQAASKLDLAHHTLVLEEN